MPEVDINKIDTLLINKYKINPHDIKTDDVPRIVTILMEFIDEGMDLTAVQKKEYIMNALIILAKNSKLTEDDTKAFKTIVDSYVAVNKTVEVATKALNKSGGCCIIA